jgi:hypothetical protein
MNRVLWQNVSICLSKVAATKNSGPFCFLYGYSQSRLRAVLFILDTNWTQRFRIHLLSLQVTNQAGKRISIRAGGFPLTKIADMLRKYIRLSVVLPP